MIELKVACRRPDGRARGFDGSCFRGRAGVGSWGNGFGKMLGVSFNIILIYIKKIYYA